MSEVLSDEAHGIYSLDRARYPEEASFFNNHSLRFLWVLRKAKTSRNPLWKILHARMRERYGLEIPIKTDIGYGVYLGHAFNITINPDAVIGRNCNVHKGVTIGRENRGKRKGAPSIGDEVWIGVNATVVGGIKVGSDVLIAPNSYVNCDVPDHSIVLGNPCRIIACDNATEHYINRKI
ncbi:serine acetyltransferase [Thermophilibacter provencensis]|uniref:serine acetyltransferase n=1 Tax=Thermophilibacter provencensis TaxID=1852386 RepID=UPI00294213E0|nr:serine acetyltransferase [Thermophilibacter provencensis]